MSLNVINVINVCMYVRKYVCMYVCRYVYVYVILDIIKHNPLISELHLQSLQFSAGSWSFTAEWARRC